MPRCSFPKLSSRMESFLFYLFAKIGLIKKKNHFLREKISLRTSVFIEEAEKRGIKFWAFQGPAGYMNYFQMQFNNRFFNFEGLPRAEFLNNSYSDIIDDKWLVKEVLKKENLPFAEGRAFWFFQKKQALQYGLKLDFPLVVKPRWGSMSQHVTINVQDEEALKQGISRAIAYSPAFLVEKYLPKTRVYRATVVDAEFVACVERVPAHVIGDGQNTIQELIDLKNRDPRRGKAKQKNTTLFQLVIDETSCQLLKKQGYQLSSTPAPDEIVYLQEKIILDLGADLNEVTPAVHPDNLELFRSVAKIFNIRLVGIDFLAGDIGCSWRNQPAAIIELNSLPYIDMHHFPTSGQPVNIAEKICEMVLKYYVSH